MGDTPQNKFQNAQNYDPDIVGMFRHWVTGGTTPNDPEAGEIIAIDDLRASISIGVTGQGTENLLKSLNLSPTSTSAASTPNTSTPGQAVQESRCHTFYRIIGFPVVSEDKKSFYNPGYDIIKKKGIVRKIKLKDKIVIASKIDKKFEKLSQAREAYSNNTAQIFNVPESVGAGVLSLMSGTYGAGGSVNKRPFALPFAKSTEAFDFDIANQTHNIDVISASTLVGSDEVPLFELQDATANTVVTSGAISTTNPSVFRQHLHIIKPFMVDPRIDFSIWSHESHSFGGVSKRIAVPFVTDAYQLQTSSVAKAEAPLLEKIIKERFSQSNNTSEAGQGVSDTVDYVKEIAAIQTDQIGTATISQIFSGKTFQLDQQGAFSSYLSIIKGMMKKLVTAMHTIHAAQGKYYWLPQPSTRGPEGGCTVRPVPLNKDISSRLIGPSTPLDFNIAFSYSQSLLSNLPFSTSQASTTSDTGGFSTDSLNVNKNTFNSSSSNSQGDLSSRTKEMMVARRKEVLRAAGDALQVVEMIMGEYSGFGLCDIVAIIGSLYVVKKEILLGLLDDDAYDRAKKVLGQALPGRPASIEETLKELSNTVNGFYQIMDVIFQDYMSNNSLDQENT